MSEGPSGDQCELINCWPPPSPENLNQESESTDKTSKHAANTNLLGKRENLSPSSSLPLTSCDDVYSPPVTKKARLTHRKSEVMATVALARWWRTTGRHQIKEDFPASTNPNTRLRIIARSEDAQHFLKQEVDRLQRQISTGEVNGNMYAVLGSFYEKLGDLVSAQSWLEKALAIGPYEAEHRWLLEKIKKKICIQKCQDENRKRFPNNEMETKSLRTPKQVQRRSADSLSLGEFLSDYAMTSTPVVITDLVKDMTIKPWSIDHIKQVAGSTSATLKKYVPNSVEWAQLEDCDTSTVADFIDRLKEYDSVDISDKQYLFDWSIPIHCPQLAEQLVIPKYFAGDFLQRTRPGSLYKDSWPSMFIAPAGLCSELHVDAFGSNFWMALFEGRKRWVFFSKEDTPFLYPDYEGSMDPVFSVSLSEPDFTKHPLISLAQPIECILEPGEVLFVPSGCPHRVENLEASLAISANYVDLSNFETVKQELVTNGLLDERSNELLAQFMEPDFCTDVDAHLLHQKWSDFKNRNNTYSRKLLFDV